MALVAGLGMLAPAAPAAAAVPTFDVGAYGARPGDGADDTAAFTRALAAAGAAGDGVVRAAAGMFDVQPDRLALPAGVTLTGAGAGTVLRPTTYGFQLVGVGDRTTLANLTVDGLDQVPRGVTVARGATAVRLTGLTVRRIAPPRDATAPGYAAHAGAQPAAIRVSGDTDGVLVDRVLVDGVRAAAAARPYVTDTGDFETADPVGGWDRENADRPYSYRTVTAPVRAGGRAVRMELRSDDPPVYSGARSEFTKEAERPREEHWYGFSVLLPDGGAEDYARDRSPEIVAQWHSTPDSGAEKISPPLALLTRNGNWELHRWWDHHPVSISAAVWHAGQHEERVLGGYAADKGRWTDWAFHVRWGWLKTHKPLLEVYKNRQLVYRTTVPNTFNDAVGTYFKMGFYKWDWSQEATRSDLTTRVAYWDEYRVDDAHGSLDSVSPPNPPAGPGAWPYPVARGIHIASAPGEVIPRNVVVRASTVRNVGPKDDGDCLVIQGNGADAEPDANLLVSGNTFTGCAKRAVKIQANGVKVVGNRIGNAFLDNNPFLLLPPQEDTYDMYAGVSGYGSRLTITDNALTGTGGFYAGIDLNTTPGGTQTDILVARNTVANGPAARLTVANLVRAHQRVVNLTVQGNTLTRGFVGVRCDVPPAAPTFVGNRVTGTTMAGHGCLPAPTVAAPALLRASGGDTLTVTGWPVGATLTAYRAAPVTATVNGRGAAVTWRDAGTLAVTTPAGTPGGTATVTLARGGVPAPAVVTAGRYAATITKVSAAVPAATGATVTVTGVGLRGGTGWAVGGVPLPVAATRAALAALPGGVLVVSDTAATVKLPPGGVGSRALSFTPAAAVPYVGGAAVTYR